MTDHLSHTHTPQHFRLGPQVSSGNYSCNTPRAPAAPPRSTSLSLIPPRLSSLHTTPEMETDGNAHASSSTPPAPASRASDLARARLAKKRERERQRAELEAQSQSMTSEEPPIITPSATDSSFHSTYSSFDASAPGAGLRLGGGLGLGGGVGAQVKPTMVDADAAQHLAYIQEKDPFAAFSPPAAIPPPQLPPSASATSSSAMYQAQRHPSETFSIASLSLSRANSLRPSIDTAASMHRGVPAYKRREMLRPDHSVGIEEEQEWAEEEETMDKVGEVQLPPMPSYLSSSRLDLHPSESRNSRASMGSSMMRRTKRWDPHAKREVEKAADAPADFAVVKPDGWSAKAMGLDATYKREKRREDRRQLVGKVFGFGRKKEKEEKKERWEDEIEGRSVSVGSGSARDSAFIDLNATSSKLSLTSSNASRPQPKGILKTRPPPLPLKEDGTSAYANANASTEMLDTATPRHAIVPLSASTITSQTSLRPTPRTFVNSAGTVDTPATSLFTSSSTGEDTHGGVAKDGVNLASGGVKAEDMDKAYAAHRQSLPWGKAILSPPIFSPDPLPHHTEVNDPDAFTHPTPDFSRKATATPDSYKYSPTAEAIARYAMSDSDDTNSLHRQFIAYGTPTTNLEPGSVDSTPGIEMSADRLFYKAPKASSTALGSVTGTPGLGVVDEYPVPPVPKLPDVVVGTAISTDSAVTASTPSQGPLQTGESMSMSRSPSSTFQALSPTLGAQTVGMSVQASASSSALPYLSPTASTDDAHAYSTAPSAYPSRLTSGGVRDRSASADRRDTQRSLSPTKQGVLPQARTMVRSSSSTSDRPGAIYDHSPSHASATAEGLINVALEAGESIWDSKIYMLAASPLPSSASPGLTHAEQTKRHWEAYDHPLLRSKREKDKQATFDELACGKVGWREWLWPVPPSRPEKEMKKWRRKDRSRTRRAARGRKVQRNRDSGRMRARSTEKVVDDEDDEEEEVAVAGRDWSKVKIDGYRPAPLPPSIGRSGSFSSSVDSPLTDLAQPHSTLDRSGSSSSQSRMLLASAGANSMRRESANTLASTHSRGSISSDVTDFTIRSAGSGGTGGTARRVPPPTPPPAGPLPTAPSASGVGAVGGQVPLRTGSATGYYAPSATASPTKSEMRMRTGSFGAGAALRAKSGSSSGPVQPSAGRGVYPPPARMAGPPMQVTGSSMLPSDNGSGSSILSPSATGTAGAAEGEKETPAERRRRMRGKVAAVDLAGEIKKIDKDREAELAAAEGPIDEDRPRVIRFAGVQVLGE